MNTLANALIDDNNHAFIVACNLFTSAEFVTVSKVPKLHTYCSVHDQDTGGA
jgi:hypothetical protein